MIRLREVRRHRQSMLRLSTFLLATLAAAGAAMAQVPVCVAPPPGMVAWWTGDNTTADRAGGNTGTWTGTAAYVAGEVAQAFSLNGSSYVDAASTAALSPTAAISIDAWIQQTGASNRIVDKITAGGADGYLLDVLGGKLRLIIGGASLLGGTTLNTGTTYHVAGTYDGATMTVYVNGASDGSQALSGAIPTNALPLRIGADSTGANTFTGWIDEVEIFNRGLTAQELLAIASAGPAGKCKVGAATASVPATSDLGLLLMSLLILGGGTLLVRARLRG